jgi:nitroimidazol reductase NimA-like FMN-containing flavoprotein (pyridoxamine 5'-phosphate oxidase superfamily)
MEALLAKHHVGSMAVAFHDRVTIALSNYVYADRWIYGRMEQGPDLATLRHHRWVAFEVSEIKGIYDWRTVTVHGSIELLADDASVRGSEAFQAALSRLRSVVPAIFTPRDPIPQRVQLFRLHADELVGRESSSNDRGALPPP